MRRTPRLIASSLLSAGLIVTAGSALAAPPTGVAEHANWASTSAERAVLAAHELSDDARDAVDAVTSAAEGDVERASHDPLAVVDSSSTVDALAALYREVAFDGVDRATEPVEPHCVGTAPGIAGDVCFNSEARGFDRCFLDLAGEGQVYCTS